MKKIGIVTCKKRLNKVEDDLIIKEYLKNHDFIVDIIAWDDKRVNLNKYDVLFIRSVWNSAVNFKKYKKFLLNIDNNTKVINEKDKILDNMCKSTKGDNKCAIYIKNSYVLFKKSVINTIEELPFISVVCKPIIGESSYHVFRYNKDKTKTKNSKGINYIINKIYNDSKKYGNPGIIIEEFRSEIALGEFCIYYFNNKIIYALKKYPSVFQERKDIEIVKNIPLKIIDYVKKNEIIDGDYGRIDLLYDKDAYLMEIEKNDPDLYIRKLDLKTRDKVLREILRMIDGDNL